MRITVERYAVTNPAWKQPSERFKVLSKRFCCDGTKKIEKHLRIDGRWPPKLMFWQEGHNWDGPTTFEMNFCPGCGEKVEFAEKKEMI